MKHSLLYFQPNTSSFIFEKGKITILSKVENADNANFYSWLCPTIGMTFIDIFTDSLLAIEYYYQYNNR